MGGEAHGLRSHSQGLGENASVQTLAAQNLGIAMETGAAGNRSWGCRAGRSQGGGTLCVPGTREAPPSLLTPSSSPTLTTTPGFCRVRGHSFCTGGEPNQRSPEVLCVTRFRAWLPTLCGQGRSEGPWPVPRIELLPSAVGHLLRPLGFLPSCRLVGETPSCPLHAPGRRVVWTRSIRCRAGTGGGPTPAPLFSS